VSSNKTRNSAHADKPERRVLRSVKVTKHGTIRYVRHGFLLVGYSNVMSHSQPTYVLEFSHARIQLVQTLISAFLSWRS